MIHLLMPKNYKYKKIHNSAYSKGSINFKDIKLNYGYYGIVSNCFGSISSIQLESIRCIISKNIKKFSKIWTIIYPNFSISKKSKSSRMGTGVGCLDHWVYKVKPGSVLFEIYNINYNIIKTIFNSISCRVPFKIFLLKKYEKN